VRLATGRLSEADNAYQRSLDIAQRLADDDPDNADYQRELSVSLDKIGDVRLATGG